MFISFLAFRADDRADHLPRAKHPRNFLVRAREDAAARIAHDCVERIAETIGFDACRRALACRL